MSAVLDYDGSHLYYYPETRPDSLNALGGRWDSKKNALRLPPICASVENLKRAGENFTVASSAECFLDATYGWELDGQYFAEDLYDFQHEAMNWLISSPRPGALLALSMGLGKTRTSLRAAEFLGVKRVLIVCPLILKSSWSRECNQLLGIVPNEDITKIDDHSWNLTNYDQIVRHTKNFERQWDLIIFDESILLKNGGRSEKHNSKRWDACFAIRAYAKKVWLLSGSPISRYADDLYAQLRLIDPASFTSYWRFVDTYCIKMPTIWGDSVVGTKKNIDFQHEFRDLIFTRNQKDVLPNLPDFQYRTIDVELSIRQKKHHKELLKEFITKLDEESEMTVSTRLSQIIRLQQLVSNLANWGPEWPDSSGKRDTLVELFRCHEIQTPAIVWVNWVEGARRLQTSLCECDECDVVCELITGDVSEKERERILTLYKNSEVDVLILSLSVGKFGLTLTNTQSQIYYDRSFDGDAYVQSLHRVRRIGLDHSPMLYVLRCPGTIEELIEENLRDKSFSISKVSNHDLSLLLKSLGKNT